MGIYGNVILYNSLCIRDFITSRRFCKPPKKCPLAPCGSLGYNFAVERILLCRFTYLRRVSTIIIIEADCNIILRTVVPKGVSVHNRHTYSFKQPVTLRAENHDCPPPVLLCIAGKIKTAKFGKILQIARMSIVGERIAIVFHGIFPFRFR